MSILDKVFHKISGGSDFINFLKDNGIELPSKEKAQKILEKYDAADVKDAYKILPVLNQVHDPEEIKKKLSALFDPHDVKVIQRIIILSAIAAMFQGILPNTDKAVALVNKQELSSEKYHFNYLGKFKTENLKKIISEKDTMEQALDKIKADVSEKNIIGYSGDDLKDKELKIYDTILGDEVSSVHNLINHGRVKLYLGEKK